MVTLSFKKSFHFINVLVIIILLVTGCGRNEEIIMFRYKNLTQTGDWKLTKNDSTVNNGHIKLENKIWLMHFIHWWELNEDNKNVSDEYVRELLKNVWGMQFELTGTEGKTTIAGHEAVFVEGMLGDFVNTIFVVWNCPESGRQFLSDCNINISLNTPDKLLELQVDDITKSICCHDHENESDNPLLTNHISYENVGVSFSIPPNWHSDFYIVNPDSDKKYPGYYKDGVTEKHGVIWNLVTDSEREINFVWEKSNNDPILESFDVALFNFFNDTVTFKKDTLEYRSVYTNIINQSDAFENSYVECSGSYELVTEIVGYIPIDTSNYTYQAFFWRTEQYNCLVVATMVSHNNIWGIPVDLVPTKKQFDKFVKDDVLENIDIPVIRNK